MIRIWILSLLAAIRCSRRQLFSALLSTQTRTSLHDLSPLGCDVIQTESHNRYIRGTESIPGVLTCYEVARHAMPQQGLMRLAAHRAKPQVGRATLIGCRARICVELAGTPCSFFDAAGTAAGLQSSIFTLCSRCSSSPAARTIPVQKSPK